MSLHFNMRKAKRYETSSEDDEDSFIESTGSTRQARSHYTNALGIPPLPDRNNSHDRSVDNRPRYELSKQSVSLNTSQETQFKPETIKSVPVINVISENLNTNIHKYTYNILKQSVSLSHNSNEKFIGLKKTDEPLQQKIKLETRDLDLPKKENPRVSSSGVAISNENTEGEFQTETILYQTKSKNDDAETDIIPEIVSAEISPNYNKKQPLSYGTLQQKLKLPSQDLDLTKKEKSSVSSSTVTNSNEKTEGEFRTETILYLTESKNGVVELDKQGLSNESAEIFPIYNNKQSLFYRNLHQKIISGLYQLLPKKETPSTSSGVTISNENTEGEFQTKTITFQTKSKNYDAEKDSVPEIVSAEISPDHKNKHPLSYETLQQKFKLPSLDLGLIKKEKSNVSSLGNTNSIEKTEREFRTETILYQTKCKNNDAEIDKQELGNQTSSENEDVVSIEIFGSNFFMNGANKGKITDNHSDEYYNIFQEAVNSYKLASLQKTDETPQQKLKLETRGFDLPKKEKPSVSSSGVAISNENTEGEFQTETILYQTKSINDGAEIDKQKLGSQTSSEDEDVVSIEIFGRNSFMNRANEGKITDNHFKEYYNIFQEAVNFSHDLNSYNLARLQKTDETPQQKLKLETRDLDLPKKENPRVSSSGVAISNENTEGKFNTETILYQTKSKNYDAEINRQELSKESAEISTNLSHTQPLSYKIECGDKATVKLNDNSSKEIVIITDIPMPTLKLDTVPPVPNVNALTYELEKFPKNAMIIFNHEHFIDIHDNSRAGTALDEAALRDTFQQFRFDVTTYHDLKRNPLLTELTKFGQQNFDDYGCICVAILTHGSDHGYLKAADMRYNEREVFACFDTQTNPSLVAKPIIFLIQACRGERLANSVSLPIIGEAQSTFGKIELDSDINQENKYYVPTEADMIIFHSCFYGRASVRVVGKGTWFIQTVCEQLNLYGSTEHLEDIFRRVRHKVALEMGFEHAKQMPILSTTLLRKLYLVRHGDVGKELGSLNVQRSASATENNTRIGANLD